MATPRSSSSPERNYARDARRVWTGAGRGRGGLAPVPRSAQPLGRRTYAAPAVAGADLGVILVNSGTANGSTLGSGVTALKGSSVSNDLVDPAWASYSSATGLFTVARAGLWQLSGYIVVTSPVAKSVIQAATPWVASGIEQSPFAFFNDDFIAGVTGGWSASTCSPPTPWPEASTGYVAYAAPSSGAVLNQFYLVFRPIAFFD